MDLSSSSDEDESCHLSCEAALRNPLILQQIFTHLPTRQLLFSCSLVNKLWNREARSFIRDHRICLKKPATSQENPCKFIADLDQLCCETTARGRQIPWNGFKISFDTFGCSLKKCSTSGEKLGTVLNFKTDIKVRHLQLYWYNSYSQECRVHLPLQAVFRQCAPDLRTLKLENWSPESGEPIYSYISMLPKLEELAVSNSYLTKKHKPCLMKVVKRVVHCSPNLKKIEAKTIEDLTVFPEEVYGLMEELEFCIRRRQDLGLYQKVIEKRPALRQLVVSDCWSSIHRADNENDDDSLEKRFCTTLGLLLQVCAHSLNKMVLRWTPALDNDLSFPLLAKLTKLVFTSPDGEEKGGLWNFIVSIDYDRNMPNLKQLKIIVCTINPENRMEVSQIANITWPDVEPDLHDHPPRAPCSTSASLKLKLKLEVKRINWSRIQSQFPNVQTLCLGVNHTSVLGSEPCPVSDISRLWPRLQKLKITGEHNQLGRNYDADFCGIHEEEAEYLRQQNDTYLENVQIVPIRPCLLTMSNLCQLDITMGFCWKSGPRGGPEGLCPLEFVSPVTDLVALRETKDAAVWSYACSTSDEDTDDDYGLSTCEPSA